MSGGEREARRPKCPGPSRRGRYVRPRGAADRCRSARRAASWLPRGSSPGGPHSGSRHRVVLDAPATEPVVGQEGVLRQWPDPKSVLATFGVPRRIPAMPGLTCGSMLRMSRCLLLLRSPTTSSSASHLLARVDPRPRRGPRRARHRRRGADRPPASARQRPTPGRRRPSLDRVKCSPWPPPRKTAAPASRGSSRATRPAVDRAEVRRGDLGSVRGRRALGRVGPREPSSMRSTSCWVTPRSPPPTRSRGRRRGEDRGRSRSPVALKDNLCTRGVPTTCSSRSSKGGAAVHRDRVVSTPAAFPSARRTSTSPRWARPRELGLRSRPRNPH